MNQLLMSEISQARSKVDALLSSSNRHARALVRSIEETQELEDDVEQLEYELRCNETRAVYVHILTDHVKHRTLHVVRDRDPKFHDTLSFALIDDHIVLSVQLHNSCFKMTLRIGDRHRLSVNSIPYSIATGFTKKQVQSVPS
jgi:hypothetical protein